MNNNINCFIAHIKAKNSIPNLNRLSQRMGISHATVLRWLLGSDKPDVPNCIKLSRLSGYSVEQVIFIFYGEL